MHSHLHTQVLKTLSHTPARPFFTCSPWVHHKLLLIIGSSIKTGRQRLNVNANSEINQLIGIKSLDVSNSYASV